MDKVTNIDRAIKSERKFRAMGLPRRSYRILDEYKDDMFKISKIFRKSGAMIFSQQDGDNGTIVIKYKVD